MPTTYLDKDAATKSFSEFDGGKHFGVQGSLGLGSRVANAQSVTSKQQASLSPSF